MSHLLSGVDEVDKWWKGTQPTDSTTWMDVKFFYGQELKSKIPITYTREGHRLPIGYTPSVTRRISDGKAVETTMERKIELNQHGSNMQGPYHLKYILRTSIKLEPSLEKMFRDDVVTVFEMLAKYRTTRYDESIDENRRRRLGALAIELQPYQTDPLLRDRTVGTSLYEANIILSPFYYPEADIVDVMDRLLEKTGRLTHVLNNAYGRWAKVVNAQTEKERQ